MLTQQQLQKIAKLKQHAYKNKVMPFINITNDTVNSNSEVIYVFGIAYISTVCKVQVSP